MSDVVRALPELVLTRYEVAVTRNLHPPARSRQEVLWLEVASSNVEGAVRAARDWVAAGDEPYETTGLVRRAGPHPAQLKTTQPAVSIPVIWDVPLLHEATPGSVVRDPATGQHLGFVARPGAVRRWLHRDDAQAYVLLTRRPATSSSPKAAVPACRTAP